MNVRPLQAKRAKMMDQIMEAPEGSVIIVIIDKPNGDTSVNYEDGKGLPHPIGKTLVWVANVIQAWANGVNGWGHGIWWNAKEGE